MEAWITLPKEAKIATTIVPIICNQGKEIDERPSVIL